jgi:hypothetical protein
MSTQKLPKKVCLAIFEIDEALNDAISNRDKTVTLDTSTVLTVVEYAKKSVVEKA